MIVQERVGIGHPDKICDHVAEMVKGFLFDIDRKARTAIEVIAHPIIKDGKEQSLIKVFGEYSISKEIPNLKEEIKSFLEIKFKEFLGEAYSNYLSPIFQIDLSHQSKEITALSEEGAGDQGIIVAEYINEIDNFFNKTEKVKKNLDSCPYIGRDWKLLVTKETKSVIVNFHLPEYLNVSESVAIKHVEEIILKEFPRYDLKPIKPYRKGSILSDSGLTGRKIFCDYPFNYRWGGGAIWGKDATKVDNSALIYMRELCKQLAKVEGVEKVSITCVYNIGKRKPEAIELCLDDVVQTDIEFLNDLLDTKVMSSSVREFYPKPPTIYLYKPVDS